MPSAGSRCWTDSSLAHGWPGRLPSPGTSCRIAHLGTLPRPILSSALSSAFIYTNTERLHDSALFRPYALALTLSILTFYSIATRPSLYSPFYTCLLSVRIQLLLCLFLFTPSTNVTRLHSIFFHACRHKLSFSPRIYDKTLYRGKRSSSLQRILYSSFLNYKILLKLGYWQHRC